MCDESVKCGMVGGVCEVVNGTTDTICVCTDKSWSQSTEFLFYLDEAALVNTLRCDANDAVIKFLYSLGLLCSLVALILTVVVLRYKGGDGAVIIRRFRLIILSNLSHIIASSIRINDIDRLYGQDLLFTTFYMIGFLCARLGADQSWISFIDYIVKSFPFLETVQLNSHRLRVAQQIRRFSAFCAISNAIVGITLPFFKFQSNVALRLVYYDLAVNFLVLALVQFFAAAYLFRYLENDINIMIRDQKEKVMLDQDIKIKLRRLLPKFTMYKLSLAFGGVGTMTFSLVLFFNNDSFAIMKYMLPVGIIAAPLSQMLVVRKQIRYAANKSKKFAKVVSMEELLS
uniref:Uncharacterized protein n=1 Tax=Aplanochytrium stocchinoi TaxID=215587 RepID=A0A7S3UZ76_9STRA|mmetsp:Transcript_8119/g.10600  ORF Transcript_8119/g.10600 Transcript_8119/m.10600 type:complete len:343 (+) Transcript_8119:49-1077(+)|eukprot:CAMPEP_0204870890 /NCGR_PEP_ID=MMETSP1348-20121228/33907_1 /ASSEMBLY_ACC=CAM_ASM_000700 /TAXON_ID=215587 /ORGANISM="Aplanochytrium stocchinoi, Strain GSBS06" /LENGTH=342 /DNA_ID=CAMNT_0052024953 /DNA_START=17 /DNA_END=1045 /DNA_ORIENTATION=-